MRLNITLFFTALLFLFRGTLPAMGADFYTPQFSKAAGNYFTPFITVSEEYNDNIFETRTNRTTDFITHIVPGIAFKYAAPFWDWNLTYNFDYRYFARQSVGNEFVHNLNGVGNLRIIDNFFYLDIADTYTRVSIDQNRDRTTEGLFVNQTDQNTLTFIPYLLFRPGPKWLVKTGYQYTNVSYFNQSLIDSEEHGAFITATYEMTQKLSFDANLRYAHTNTSDNLSYDRYTSFLGFSYSYANDSRVFAQGGYSWLLLPDGNTSGAVFWNAGIIHNIDTLTASLTTGVTYNSDPRAFSTEQRYITGRLDRTLHRGTAGVYMTYSDTLDNRTGTLLSGNIGIGGTIKHELSGKLTGHLDVTADKATRGGNFHAGFPYHYYVATGVTYEMAHDLFASLDYNYITYLSEIGGFGSGITINRLIASVRKTF